MLVVCKVTERIFSRIGRSLFGRSRKGRGQRTAVLTPPGLIKVEELPPGCPLLELRRGRIQMVQASAKNFVL